MKTKTRGIRLSLFPLFLILALASVGMASAATTVTVSPSTQTVEEGQTFTIDIDVTPDAAIDKVQVDLTFDQSLVTANDVANGGMFANLVSNPIDNTNGEITSICGYNSGGATTTTPGTLTTVTFTANVAGQSPLNLVDVVVLNGVTPVPNTPQSGSVTIGDADARPSPRITAPASGSTVTGTVAITAVDDSGEDDIVRAVFEYSTTQTSYTEICTDTDGSDGWGCSWDTTAVADDDYTIRVTMYDSADQNGKSAISVSVDNVADPDYELDLDAGLNLVSIPKTINGTNDAETVFNLDPYAGEFCVYYNAGAGCYDVNPDVKQCRGYWVFKNAAETVGVSFDTDAGAASQQLYEGWNMIGHVSLEAVLIYEEGSDSDFGSLTGLEEPEETKLYRQVCAYTQADGWDYYPAGDLTDMTPGMGAWILVKQDVMMYGMP